jgi:hypothetical protein
VLKHIYIKLSVLTFIICGLASADSNLLQRVKVSIDEIARLLPDDSYKKNIDGTEKWDGVLFFPDDRSYELFHSVQKNMDQVDSHQALSLMDSYVVSDNHKKLTILAFGAAQTEYKDEICRALLACILAEKSDSDRLPHYLYAFASSQFFISEDIAKLLVLELDNYRNAKHGSLKPRALELINVCVTLLRLAR